MSFIHFLPDMVTPGQRMAGAVIAWFTEAGAAGGHDLGLILLVAMTIAVPAVAWLVVYRTLLVWLNAGRDPDRHRR